MTYKEYINFLEEFVRLTQLKPVERKKMEGNSFKL